MKFDLAELKKRLRVRAALAVTVESGRLVVDLVRREDGEFQVLKSFELAIGADSLVANADKAGKELAAQLAGEGIKERRCVVCVPASWALTTTTEVPPMADDDLRGYLELKAEREFPIAVSELRIAHSTFAAVEGKSRATLAAVAVRRLDAVERMLAAAECRATSLSLGLDACMPDAGSPAALHFVANGTHVDLVIAAGGGIAAMRSLAAPVDSETFDAAGFSREVRITLGRLPEPLRQQVTQARFSGSPVTAEALCIDIRQHLHRFGIESRLQRSASHSPGSAAADHPGAALAAAERHLRGEKVVFEFLPSQVSRWEQTEQFFQDKRRRYVALALVAAIVLPIVTYFVRAHLESSLNEEWAGMRRKVADLEALQGRIRQFRPWFDPQPQSLKIVEALATAFPEQGDVWAKSIQVVDGTKVTCSGFARSQSALLAWFDRLRARSDVTALQVQQVRGENPIQFSITYKSEANDAK